MSKHKGFEHVRHQRKLKENVTVKGLRESEKLIGQLYPVLVDEQGNILDGQHRLKVNPNWKKQVVKGADSERKRAMIRLHANWHRRRVFPDQVLRELAEITGWKGAAPYAAFLGCSTRTIQRHLPQQYKLRQRTPKRQLSLSEKKNMGLYEIEVRDKLTKEEYEHDRHIQRLKEERNQMIQQIMEHGAFMATDIGAIRCELNEIGYAAKILMSRYLSEKERQKRTYIWNFFYKLPEQDILAYVKKVNPKARLRVERVAAEILAMRMRNEVDEHRKAIFKEKVEELYTKFKQITIEFTDGTKIPLNIRMVEWRDIIHNVRPKNKAFPSIYLKEHVLKAVAKDMLGLNKYGYPLDR